MKEIGRKELWMVKVTCTILMVSLPMKESGLITLFVVKVSFIMKNLFHLITLLIIQISITFRSTGKSTKENSKMTIRKDLVPYHC